jgi:hypothetical protein
MEFYSYSVFKGLYVLGQYPVNLNIPNSKIQALQEGRKTQNGNFLENGCNDFDYISVIIYGESLSPDIKLHRWWYHHESNSRGPNMKCQFSQTCFTSQMDFTAVRYSATNNGLQNNNQFHFHDTVVKDSRI